MTTQTSTTLTIKDLVVIDELDGKSMRAVRGGWNRDMRLFPLSRLGSMQMQ